MIQTLIDKLDGFEQVRDAIVAILAAEVTSQKALATAEGKDADQWDLKIYSERSNPWADFLDAPDVSAPVVNVWFDNSNDNSAGSNVMERQDMTGVFNIDCYGYATSEQTPEGHTPGDEAAAKEAHRAARLVRNILMSDGYTYLKARGLVTGRRVRSVTAFQPEQQTASVQHVLAVRLSLNVRFSEYSPQYEGQPLEYLNIEVRRREDGSVYVVADYDYTPGE